jgi:glycerol-3-phosphate dehydrogenase
MVLDRSFLPGSTAMMIPKTTDGRVLFAIPWLDRVIVGTTDQQVASAALEPRARRDELDFLCENTARYLVKAPTPADALATYAGIRPLVMRSAARTAELPRDHLIRVSSSGLVSITGGKWTTYRQMAEETIDRAAAVADLPQRPCNTRELPLIGAGGSGTAHDENDTMHFGSEREQALACASSRPELMERIHARLPYRRLDIVWSVRHEFARTLEDIMSRRTRSLLLDVRASLEAAPSVALLIAAELGRDGAWAEQQVGEFRALAASYLP